MIIFKYKEESTGINLQKIKRPIADVYIKTSSNDWLKFHPYIDSGADLTMIPLSFGKLLGLHLDKNKVQEIGGIKGSVPVIFNKIQMKIEIVEFSVNIAWSLIEDVPPLLGRADVFDKFKVTFEQYKGIIIFEKRE